MAEVAELLNKIAEIEADTSLTDCEKRAKVGNLLEGK